MKKCNYYFFISILEVIVFLAVVLNVSKQEALDYCFENYEIQENDASGKIYTEKIVAQRGIYEVNIQYEKNRGKGICYAHAEEIDVHTIYSDKVALSALQERREFDIYVNHDVNDLQFVIEPQEVGNFEIKSIVIKTADNSQVYQIFCVFIKLTSINLIVLLIYTRKKKFSRYYEVVGCLVIGLMASLGVLGKYYIFGHDLYFHMYRIEGLKEGLLSGQFPVRIQPEWFNGYGYPVSVMYGDTLLYFPALLRVIGVNLQNAYKCYIAMINIMTAVVSYYVFFRMSKNKHIAIAGSCVYTLAPYRLVCIYIRAAIGEYTAMTFLPLIVLGFWLAFEAHDKEKISMMKSLPLIIGFSGVIQSHVLSCVMVALMIIILCIILWKKVFQKNRFLYFVKAAMLTVLVNLWFLIPFFSYYKEDFKVKHLNENMMPSFQKMGADLEELFMVNWNGTTAVSWGEIASISGKFAKPVGSTFLLALLIFSVLYHKDKLQKYEKKSLICACFLVLTIYMASSLFPYYAIWKWVPMLGKFIAKIQFPWRFLSIAGMFGSVLVVLILMAIYQAYEKRIVANVIGVLVLICVLQGTQLISSAMYRGDCCLSYDLASYAVDAVTDGEYLYEGVFGPNTEGAQDIIVQGADISNYSKEGLNVYITGKSNGQENYVLLPMYYYPGYVAEDIITGESLTLTSSEDNHRIRVNLPDDYNGTFHVCFQEPIGWRLAEISSLVTIFILITCKKYNIRKYKKEEGC